MKIDPTIKSVAPSPVQEERSRAAKQPAEKASSTSAPVSVKLSPLSAQLKQIEAGLETEKAVDSKRVAEVKKAIEDGSFKVDAEKVADRLIEHTRDFLRAHKQ